MNKDPYRKSEMREPPTPKEVWISTFDDRSDVERGFTILLLLVGGFVAGGFSIYDFISWSFPFGHVQSRIFALNVILWTVFFFRNYRRVPERDSP